MVDEVERLGAELEPSLLVNRERLEQAEVPVLEARLVDQVTDALRVERPGRRLGKDLRAIGIRRRKPLAATAERPDDPGSAVYDSILAVNSASEVGVQTDSRIITATCDAAG